MTEYIDWMDDLKIGQKVFDDLTGKQTVIVSLDTDRCGNVKVSVESEYLEGARFPWEVSPVQSEDV